MDRFTKLLVLLPPDQPTQAVVRTADALAAANEAEVSLADVIDVDVGGRFWRSPKSGELLEQALVEASEQRLTQIARLFKNVKPEVVVRTGADFIEVIGQVFERDHDLVLVGSQPRSSASARLDPTVTHLLRKCPVPVWVVDESHEEGDVIVALGPDYDDESKLLNRTLLELGSSLAARKEVELHVVHAWRVVGESLMLGGRVSLSDAQAKELVAESESAAHDLVSNSIRDVPAAQDATIHLMRGRPEEKVIQVVDEVRPSVVVMGTVARRGLAGMIIGNTAERVLLTIDASVMAVKPPWFESPVPRPLGATALAID